MDDLISRQAVIDAFHYWFADGFNEDRWWNSTHVLAAIEALPSAQPERKTGNWIDGYKRQKCSVCGYRGMRSWQYCPYCGAKMEVEQDDTNCM